MKKKAFDLLTLGEILLRLSPPDNERIVRGETFQKQVGGAELNVASGVSLLGLRFGIISRIPDSSIGIFAKNKIRFCGVQVSSIPIIAVNSTSTRKTAPCSGHDSS